MDEKYGSDLMLRDELSRSPIMMLWQLTAPADYWQYVDPTGKLRHFWGASLHHGNPPQKPQMIYTEAEILAELEDGG